MYNLLNEDGNEDDIKWLLSIVVKRILDKYHSQSRELFDFYLEGSDGGYDQDKNFTKMLYRIKILVPMVTIKDCAQAMMDEIVNREAEWAQVWLNWSECQDAKKDLKEKKKKLKKSLR